MKRSLALIGWLVLAWLAMWHDVSFANVFTGVMFAIILVVAFPVGRATRPGEGPARSRSSWRDAGFTIRPWPALKFLGFFAWKLVEANAIVAWQVIRPASSVVEGIVAVELHTSSDGIATMVADAITLTPGTMTIDIDRPADGPITLYVHVLQLGDPDDIRADGWTFEAMSLAAFGDPSEMDRPLLTSPGGGSRKSDDPDTGHDDR